MKTLRFLCHAAAFAVVLMLGTSLAHAQASRTWVSGVGDDANPCSRTARCKTFSGAISKTAVNGEIDCLDPGGFGAVTITKSITIDAATATAGWRDQCWSTGPTVKWPKARPLTGSLCAILAYKAWEVGV